MNKVNHAFDPGIAAPKWCKKLIDGCMCGLTSEAHANIGRKDDIDKPMWRLLPWIALGRVVDVLTYGAKEYGPENWRAVPDAKQRYQDALFRHLAAHMRGEKLDAKSGLSHLAHAACNVLFLMELD